MFSINPFIDEEVDLLLELVGNENIDKISKEVITNKNGEGSSKPSKIFAIMYNLIERQFKDDLNPFSNQEMNEYPFKIAFIYPLFFELFYDISQKEMYQKW